MRRPVRTITLPPISSRRIRLGDPTSSRPSGVTVAAFSPSPCAAIARAASCTTPLAVARLLRERQVEARQRELDAEDVRLQHADGCLEQLLPRLVALEDDDRARVHRAAV